MGCYVNIASAQTRVKSRATIIVSLLHVMTGIIFIGLSLVAIEMFVFFTGIGIIEFLIARWLWSLRIEAWGIAVGFSIFHIIYPLALPISIIGFIAIAIVSIVQLVFLAQVRREGFYSFVHLARVDPIETLEPTPVQKTVFNLVFVAQLVKALFVFLGLLMLYSYESVMGPLDWYGIPLFPIVLSFGILDLVAAIGFLLGQDWAFQLVLIMAALGLTETVLAGSAPILLVAVWIITLLLPCWAKWGFYPKVLHRVKSRAVEISMSHQNT
ncbi:MAG: hypothetical protein ACTSUO_03170 [Candidatus Thorarchaeota archaeon]